MVGMPMSHRDEIRRRLHDGQQAFLAGVGEMDVKSAIDQLFGDDRRGFAIVLDTQNSSGGLCHTAAKWSRWHRYVRPMSHRQPK